MTSSFDLPAARNSSDCSCAPDRARSDSTLSLVSDDPPSGLADCTDVELADEICTWAERVAAGEARVLTLIAAFDRREAWAVPGLLSCAHWLQWRINLSPDAAREKVRATRRPPGERSASSTRSIGSAPEPCRPSWSSAGSTSTTW